MEPPERWSRGMLQFVREVSDELPAEAEALFREDPESLETYLASEAFLQDLLSRPDPLQVEPAYFFEVLFRQFRRRLAQDARFREAFYDTVRETSDESWEPARVRSFFEDRALIEYLVDLLSQFVRREDVYRLPTDRDREYRYVFEMLEASLDSNDRETFRIYCHVGNYSLYLTGLFPDWVRHRHRYRNRPLDVDSYRNYGRAFYGRAASHRQADSRQMRAVLTKLHRGYDLVRSSLSMIFRELIPAL